MRFGIRELIFFLVLFAVPVATYFYVIAPMNKDISLQATDNERMRHALEEVDLMRERVPDITKKIAEGRRIIEEIELKLPSEKEVEVILEQVWQLAKRNGLVVKKVKSEKPVAAAGYLELPLRMTMEGSFDGYYQFLLELETLPRITRVHELMLERASETKGPSKEEYPEGWTKMDFTLSIYFQPVGGSSPSIAAAPTGK